MADESSNQTGNQTLQISGEEMLTKNVEALDDGKDLPFSDDGSSLDPKSNANNEADPNANVGDINNEADPSGNANSDDNTDAHAKRMSREAWAAAGNDPDKYLSQEEFDRVGELRDESNLQLAKRAAQTEGLLKEVLANQQSMLVENSNRIRNETIANLKAEQKEAVDIGDTEAALAIERDIHKHDKPAAQPQQVDQNIQNWFQANDDWYGVDQSATGLMNVELKRSQAKGIPFDEAIGPAVNKVKSTFPYLFDDPANTSSQDSTQNNTSGKPLVRPRNITDSSRQPAPNKQKGQTIKDLPAEIQKYALQVIKKTGISEKDYMAAYTA